MLLKDENINNIHVYNVPMELEEVLPIKFINIDGLVKCLIKIDMSKYNISSSRKSKPFEAKIPHLVIQFENFRVRIYYNKYIDVDAEEYTNASSELLKMIRNYKIKCLKT